MMDYSALTPYVILIIGILWSWFVVHRVTKNNRKKHIQEKLYASFATAHSKTLELIQVMGVKGIKNTDELDAKTMLDFGKIIGDQAGAVYRLMGLTEIYVDEQTTRDEINDNLKALLNISQLIDQEPHVEIYKVWENMIQIIKNAKL
ncbi:MAG: hypothetical protein IH840_09005 [Candidatus Heimdallarchaeota archaeon]|nr:hypothetical protein [Candidatus Heimdallarchaeota archaeon]